MIRMIDILIGGFFGSCALIIALWVVMFWDEHVAVFRDFARDCFPDEDSE